VRRRLTVLPCPGADLGRDHGDDRSVVQHRRGGDDRRQQPRQCPARRPCAGLRTPEQRLQGTGLLHRAGHDVKGGDREGRRARKPFQRLVRRNDTRSKEGNVGAEDGKGWRKSVLDQEEKHDRQNAEGPPGLNRRQNPGTPSCRAPMSRYQSANIRAPASNATEGRYPRTSRAWLTSAKVRSTSPGCAGRSSITGSRSRIVPSTWISDERLTVLASPRLMTSKRPSSDLARSSAEVTPERISVMNV
jgi:hypothetical protein